MNLQLIRHSTLIIKYSGKTLLLDPMLSPAGSMQAAPNTANALPNPLIDLNVDIAGLLETDAVLLTHTHRDHFDDAAASLLSKTVPFFCQPDDVDSIRAQGFVSVEAIETSLVWEGIRISRTSGQHGTGDIGKRMGPVSGYVLQAEGEPTLYLAGDTVWCEEVEQALAAYQPEVAVVFAGAAQFLEGGPITMTADDIQKTAEASPGTRIVVAHMDSWNHCLLKRTELRDYVREHRLEEQIRIPEDGEWIDFPA